MRAPFITAALACAGCSALVGLQDIEVPEVAVEMSVSQLDITAGSDASLTLRTTVTAGSPQELTLTVAGLPPGVVVAAITPASMRSGESAMITFHAERDAAEAAQVVRIDATTPTSTQRVELAFQVVAPSDFALQLATPMAAVAAGASVTYDVRTAATSGRPEMLALATGSLPAGISATFEPATVRAGESARLTLRADARAAALASTEFIVEGRAPSATHTTSGWIEVTNDLTLQVTGSAPVIRAGGTGAARVTVAITSGPDQRVTLEVAGLPPGVSATFAPASLSGAGSSTLTLVAAPEADPATATLTITAALASGRARSAQLEVEVGPPFVVNGGFETGDLGGWIYDEDLARTVDKGAHGGAYAAWIGTDFGLSLLGQKIEIPATGKTQLRAWVYHVCQGRYPSDSQQMLVLRSDFSLARVVYDDCLNSDDWTELTTDLTAFAGQSVYVVFYVNDEPEGLFTMSFVDDVVITNR